MRRLFRRCEHPDESVELGPPDRSGFHVARCTDCYERFLWHDRRVSDSYLAALRDVGMDDRDIARIERSNEVYEAKRARYEAAR